ncbi:MAG TPA: hypothetical protein VGV59_05770 [Pyrinomonadaceae bacterium]|nr:hypothetical protein [Pyrinomonadaceae bacterium]
MKFSKTTARSSRGDLLLQLAQSFGAAVAVTLFKVSVNFQNQHRVNLLTNLEFMLIAVTSYPAVAILLHRFWSQRLRSIIPNWMMIAVLGSILFVCSDMTPGIIKGWYDPLRTESSLFDYLAVEFNAAGSVVIALSLITLLVTGSIYFMTKRFFRTLPQ